MNLTFKGFLRNYCRELTGLETDNLKKLLSSVTSDSPAAAEAVMLFSAVQGKSDYLVGLSFGTWVHDQYQAVSKDLSTFKNLKEYLSSDCAPERYKKVWNAFCAKKGAIKADRRVSALMREKSLAAIKKSGLTAYQISKTMKLDLGNVYAYLNARDVTKVSRNTAREIMQFAMTYHSAD